MDARIEKIKALLAMASDLAASEQERETAERQAGKLMAKYELDELDLEVSEYDLIEDSVSGMRPGKKSGSKVPPWIGIMAVGIKHYCGVRVFIKGERVYFRGVREQVELGAWMLNAMIHQCYGGSKGQSDPSAWRNGFASAVQARLKRMSQLGRDEGGTSLIVLRTRLEEAMSQQWDSAGTSVRRSNVNKSDSGREAGNKAHIPTNRPLNTISTLRLK